MKSKEVLIIGGGAAGMIAGISAAREGATVTIFEKNEKLGKKLFITGKGRCNLTNGCESEGFFEQVISNKKFMYSSFYSFDNFQVMAFFESLGLSLKEERGERVFPASDRSSDVIKALERELRKQNVKILLGSEVTSLNYQGDVFQSLSTRDKEYFGDSCIVATGGRSYESTGSTGDGYKFAKERGLNVISPRPALVGLEVRDPWVPLLQGLSLKNVKGTFLAKGKVLYQEFGEMLFTHYGISGPIVLSGSSACSKALSGQELTFSLDLKPALSEEQLDKRILREFEAGLNKQFKNVITALFPAKFVPVLLSEGPIRGEQVVNEITKEMRQELVTYIKNVKMTVTRPRPFKEAIITAGGVDVKELNPSTLETKKITGLYFAGEVIDVDALTGGFNLQIAWSTGYQAGISAAKGEENGI
ncbi:NAD(P)/FAD-dependent oxidoreductase [Lachnospiraceae bacterium OttesenSCG-928-J05]|nr:NAD(P)/FAD-dependent oxidoreductase [Lachnospiraceae bacterium OttesenSCG-928-J05]